MLARVAEKANYIWQYREFVPGDKIHQTVPFLHNLPSSSAAGVRICGQILVCFLKILYLKVSTSIKISVKCIWIFFLQCEWRVWVFLTVKREDGIGVLARFILNSQKEKERMESVVNNMGVVAGLFEWITIQYWFVALPLKESGKDLTLVKNSIFPLH